MCIFLYSRWQIHSCLIEKQVLSLVDGWRRAMQNQATFCSAHPIHSHQTNKECWTIEHRHWLYFSWPNCTRLSQPPVCPILQIWDCATTMEQKKCKTFVFLSTEEKMGAHTPAKILLRAHTGWGSSLADLLVAIQTTLFQKRAIVLRQERIDPDPEEREDWS